MLYDMSLKLTSPLGCTTGKYDLIISAPAEEAKMLRCSLPSCLVSYDSNIMIRIRVLCNGVKELPSSGCIDNSRFVLTEIIPVDNDKRECCNMGRKEGVVVIRALDPCVAKFLSCYPESSIVDNCNTLKLTLLFDRKGSADPCECGVNELIEARNANRIFNNCACGGCGGCGGFGGFGNCGFNWAWWIIILLLFGWGWGFGGFGGFGGCFI